LKITKITILCATATLLLSATMSMAFQSATQSSTAATTPAAPAAKKTPAAKTKTELDAYKAAAAITDAAKLEAAANDFAQKFPNSELRPLLFQQAMGFYEHANNSGKTLEMARDVLKYDPTNAVALLAAGQILSERTHNEDLDRDARLDEASADARSALQHSGDLQQPANMTPEQFAVILADMRGSAHEVLGEVAFKKLDYFNAIKEYNAAVVEEKDHVDAVTYLRLAVAYDKTEDYLTALDTIQKAIKVSEPGSQVRQISEQEKERLDKLTPIK